MMYNLIVAVLALGCLQCSVGNPFGGPLKLLDALSASEKQQDESCPDLYEPVGCFGDRRSFRAVGKLLITDRDRYSPLYSGREIDWGNFDVYLRSLACRCARKAKVLGFSYFGLQYFGECFSGMQAASSYNFYGQSKHCVSGYYGECGDSGEGECIGMANANFVYKLKKAEPDGSGSGSGSGSGVGAPRE